MCFSAEWHGNMLVRLPVIVIHAWGKEFIGGYFWCLTISGVPSLWSVHSVAMGLWCGRMSVQRECVAKQRLLTTGSREACPQTEKGAGISRLIPESSLMTCLRRPLSTFYFPELPIMPSNPARDQLIAEDGILMILSLGAGSHAFSA